MMTTLDAFFSFNSLLRYVFIDFRQGSAKKGEREGEEEEERGEKHQLISSQTCLDQG